MNDIFISKRTGERMVRITVTIPETLFNRLEREAKLYGLSRSGMVQKALNKAIPRFRRKKKTADPVENE
jgi:metal-responsive CopG/Arc/MetJ family transcriptional regulator